MNDRLQFTHDYQKRIPFVSHLKILTETLGEGTARLSLPIEPHLTNSLGTSAAATGLSCWPRRAC